MPATGSGPMTSCTMAASWWGSPNIAAPRPLQVNSERAIGGVTGEERGQVLGGGAGVADLELHGGAHGHLVADGDRAAPPGRRRARPG